LLPPPVRPCATPLLLAAHGWAMPMVPCPECEVPQYRHHKPKAGAKRRQCDACRAKRRQRKACREKPCEVTCGRSGCANKIALPRAPRRSTTSHVCGDCQAKEQAEAEVAAAAVTCTECDRPWLRLTKGRGAHRQTRCRECRRASGVDATTLHECPQCEQPCDPLEVRNGSEMYARCAQCKHEESPDVVCGDLCSLARASPYKIATTTMVAADAQRMFDAGDITETEFETLIALAEKEIDQHMRVTNAEKVALFDKYDKAMRYPGHCCAACGVRDATADYDRIYVDLGNPDLAGYDGRGATRQALVRGGAGVGGGPPVAVRVQTLPDWLRVEETDIERLQRLTCGVYVEHDDDPDKYARVDVSALELRYVTRGGNAYYHLIEEAVSAVETDTRGSVSLVTMFVCCHCTRAVSGSRRLKAGAAPEHSMAALDYGRRYLSPRTVDRLRGSLRDTHSEYPSLRLDERGWRLPIPSVLEKTLLATCYLHIMVLTVACEGEAAGGGSGGDGGRSHATMRKHTVYFPVALLDAQDRTRECAPWATTRDAIDALRIAVGRVPLVFVGPDGEFDTLKRASLSMKQMQVRPEAVYTLIMLGQLRRVEKSVKALHGISDRLGKPGADVVDLRFEAVSHGVDDEELERKLRARVSSAITYADVLKDAVNKQANELLRKDLDTTGASLSKILEEALDVEGPGGLSKTMLGLITRDAANVSCRGAGSDAAREASDREVSDVAQVRGDRRRGPRGTDGDEAEPVAGCLDASNTAGHVINACARLLRRGTETLDDYSSQSVCLYGAHHDLFPIGEGLVEGKPLTREKSRHLMLFHDGRFAQDLSLVFSLADTISRHAVNRSVRVRARKSPGAIRKVEALIADPGLRAKLLEACREPRGDVAVQLIHDLMPFVNMSANATPYTDASRAAFTSVLFGYNRWQGPASCASPHCWPGGAEVLTASCAQISSPRLRTTFAT
jgi:hypothetical protein